MLEIIERAFAPELLSVSSNASRIADFIWTIHNIGGTVPVSTLAGQFDKAGEYVEVLSKAGILRYSLGGFINKDQRKESISVFVSEDFSSLLTRGIKRKDFENILFRKYGEKLIGFCRSDLTEPLAVMLTSVIFYATPNRPVFVNMVVRKGAKVCLKRYVECKDLLDYYLHKFLGLITFESGSTVNLSVRSKQRVRAFPKIWEMYVREYKDKPREEEIKRPVVERREVPSKVSEQEKKLRGYFPWLKL
jgi:hypothetical protein